MLIRKTNPVGVDLHIDRLQELLYDRVTKKWGTPEAPIDWMCYPRVYRNQVEDGYTAEHYLGNGEYKETYLDDSKDMVSFFGTSTTANYRTGVSTSIHLVVFANLQSFGDSLLVRNDESFRAFFIDLIGDGVFGLELTDISTGIAAALKEYPGKRRDALLDTADMSPWHVFRLDFDLMYDASIIC